MALPAFAAERRAAAQLLLGTHHCRSTISCPDEAHQQTHHTLGSNNGTDRQTNGRTTDHYIDSAPHIERAASMIAPSVRRIMHTGWAKKWKPQTYGHNSVKSSPIFKFFH